LATLKQGARTDLAEISAKSQPEAAYVSQPKATMPSIACMHGAVGFFQSGGLMGALYVCASILVFALLAVVVLGMTVSQCRPSMFVPDNPYSAKTERNWTTDCTNVFSYRR